MTKNRAISYHQNRCYGSLPYLTLSIRPTRYLRVLRLRSSFGLSRSDCDDSKTVLHQNCCFEVIPQVSGSVIKSLWHQRNVTVTLGFCTTIMQIGQYGHISACRFPILMIQILQHIRNICMNLYQKNWGLKSSHCDTKMTSIWPKSQKNEKTAHLPCLWKPEEMKWTLCLKQELFQSA